MIFVKLILAIPHLIIVWVLSIPLALLTIIAWFAILFTGRYPRAFFEFNTGVLRWYSNVFAYVMLMRDDYPPFSWEPGEYPLTLDIPLAGRQSRLRLFVRAFTIIPNYIVFYFVTIGFYFTTFVAWWAILFTGRYPRGLFNFNVGVMRWYNRQQTYLYLMRDEYPPYSISAQARPGNEVVSGIIGAPIFALYVAFQVTQFSAAISGDSTVHTALSATAIRRDHPTARAGSLRLTLLDYTPDSGGFTSKGTSFEILAEKDGFFPTFFTPVFLSVQPCFSSSERRNSSYSIDDWEGDGFDIYWRGGSDRATVYFDIADSNVCGLSYFTTSGTITFDFD